MAWYDWGDRKAFDRFIKDHPQYRNQIYAIQSYFDKEMTRLYNLCAQVYHMWDIEAEIPKWSPHLDEAWDTFVAELDDAEYLMRLRRKKDIHELVLNNYESED